MTGDFMPKNSDVNVTISDQRRAIRLFPARQDDRRRILLRRTAVWLALHSASAIYPYIIPMFALSRLSTAMGMSRFFSAIITRAAPKKSGAWMSNFRGQKKLDGAVRPIVVNVMNLSKPSPGRPTLLTLDEVRTLFHEFGHALHGMLSDVVYPSMSGTATPADFVEFPSQLYEHWALQPEILQRFALHWETGEAIPQDMIERITAARHFNQGFGTVEFCASAYVDFLLHSRPEAPEDITTAESRNPAWHCLAGRNRSAARGAAFFSYLFRRGLRRWILQLSLV